MNLKLHILAVSVFIMLGMVLLVVTGNLHFGNPPSAEPAREEKFIRLASATWGQNCNQFIKALRDQSYAGGTREDAPPPLRKDNVLRPISSLCNGKQNCTFTIDEKTLGDDPIPSCTKELRLEYRCETYDRLRRVVEYDDKRVTLDCNAAYQQPKEKKRGR